MTNRGVPFARRFTPYLVAGDPEGRLQQWKDPWQDAVLARMRTEIQEHCGVLASSKRKQTRCTWLEASYKKPRTTPEMMLKQLDSLSTKRPCALLHMRIVGRRQRRRCNRDNSGEILRARWQNVSTQNCWPS